jgi:Kef-type K+ transport system membrane component KefB
MSVGLSARVLSELGRRQDAAARVVLGAAVVDDILGPVRARHRVLRN